MARDLPNSPKMRQYILDTLFAPENEEYLKELADELLESKLGGEDE